MIELSTATAVMLYLFFTLVVLLGLFVYQHFFLQSKKVVLSEEELFRCEYCHFAYLAGHTKKVTKCPQCNSFNKDNKFKKSI
jgi:hypothetical protein